MGRPRRRSSATRYEQTLDALPDLAWVCEKDGGLVYLNRAGRDFFRVPLDDLLGWSWDRVIHPADLPGTVAAWTAAVGSGEQYRGEYRLRRHDGEFRWFVGRAHPVARRRERVWFGSATDIHTWRTVDNGARTTQALFQGFVERAGDGYLLLTVEGRVCLASRTLASRLGRGVDELRGRPFHLLVVPDDGVGYTSWLNLLLETPGRALPFRGSFCHRGGSKVELKATGMNLLATPDVQAIAVFFTDEGA